MGVEIRCGNAQNSASDSSWKDMRLNLDDKEVLETDQILSTIHPPSSLISS
jgi:hypothetical protein